MRRNKAKVLEWITYAENDLGVASHLNKLYRPLPANIICWLCQQSVEKSYKAILAYHDIKIPKTHDIRLLQNITMEYEPSISIDVKIADKFTEFATESRYPDNVFDFTNEDAEVGLKYAKITLDNVIKMVQLTEQSNHN